MIQGLGIKDLLRCGQIYRLLGLPRAWSSVCSIRGSGIEGLLGGRSRRVAASLDREETAEDQVRMAKPQPLRSFIPRIYDPRSV